MATAAPPRATPTAADDRANISRVPYLPGLDGMRALAVIAVMVYHANSTWLPGGFLGVEMFFVISGYLITLLLIAERERTYTVSLRQFWMRRARRLLPAAFMMMALVSIWTAIFKPSALGQLRGDVLAGIFYVSNWYQIWTGIGYTAAADFAPLRHLWSLAVEEQFYLLWPVIMILLLGRAGTRRIANVSRWLFVAAVALTVLVAILYYPGAIGTPETTPEAYWWLGDRPISKLDTLYLGTFSRASALLLGAAFAMVWRPYAVARGPLRKRGAVFDAGALLAVILLALMCWNVYLVTPQGTADRFLFQGGFFVASLATLVMIAAVTHQHAIAGRVLGTSVLLWIGTRSYGLYLYHWPIFQMMRDVAGNKLDLRQFVIAMTLTCIITELSYRYLELPIRRGQFTAALRRVRANPNPRPRRLLAGGAALALALTLFAGATLATADLEQNEVAQDLGAAEDFTTDLTNLGGLPEAQSTDGGPLPTLPVTIAPDALTPVTSVGTPPATTLAPVTTTAGRPDDEAVAEPAGDPSADPAVVPASTAPPPPTTLPPVPTTTLPPPPPVPQLGVITDVSTVTPVPIPPTAGGVPLIALGDSVMLGAAEELGRRGFVVDAVVSRQMITFLPDLQMIRDNGTLGSVVVVHLGTNGPFGQETLDSTMMLLADVPIVLALTGKADRPWIGGNNEKVRLLPQTYPNVTVVDWEVLSANCEGRCFYDDQIHLTQSGQDYYTSLIADVLGLA
ncbi:MAG: acyltransferase family protein [Ilumatobacteraceae bacterium]